MMVMQKGKSKRWLGEVDWEVKIAEFGITVWEGERCVRDGCQVTGLRKEQAGAEVRAQRGSASLAGRTVRKL